MSSVENPKRSLEEPDNEEQEDAENSTINAKRKRARYGNSYLATLQWKLWILKNYTFSEGSAVPMAGIVERAEKENGSLQISPCLTKISLGMIISDLWGKKVKRVRRGPRCEQKSFYFNVACKQNPTQSSDNNLRLDFEDMMKCNLPNLPDDWFKIVDNQNKICFVHPENWEFEQWRIYTEIQIELSAENVMAWFIKSHGNKVNLEEMKFQQILRDLPVKVQVETLVQFVQMSEICHGCHLLEDFNVPIVSHKSGTLQSLKEPDALPQKGVFSSDCTVIASSGNQCPRCHSFRKAYKIRTKRREKRTSIHKHCNKRYLTEEEIQLQLKEEIKLHKKRLQEQQEHQTSDSENDEEASESENDEEVSENEHNDQTSESEHEGDTSYDSSSEE